MAAAGDAPLPVSRLLVVGTYAERLSSDELARRANLGDGATHRWTCLLRGAHCEDTSGWIRRVILCLHNSFVQPNRTFERPPYEVSEFGWGEFEIVVKVYLADSNEKPIEIRHWLRLYPSDHSGGSTNINIAGSRSTGHVVTSETYEAVVFENAASKMYDILRTGAEFALPPIGYTMQQYFATGQGWKAAYLRKCRDALQHVREATDREKKRYTAAALEIEKAKEIYFGLHDGKAAQILNAGIDKALVDAGE